MRTPSPSSAFLHHQGASGSEGDSGGLSWGLVVLLGNVLASALPKMCFSRHRVKKRQETSYRHPSKLQKTEEALLSLASSPVLLPFPHTSRMSKRYREQEKSDPGVCDSARSNIT